MLGTFAWSGFRFARSFSERAGSPEQRESAVLSLLRAETLPPGYYAVGSLHIPLVMRLAVISNRPPSPDGAIETGDRTLFYARASSMFAIDREDEQALMEVAGLEIGQETELAQGVLEIEGGELHYRSQTGDLTFQGATHQGIVTTMSIRCFERSDFQAAVWLIPSADGSAAAQSEQNREQTPNAQTPNEQIGDRQGGGEDAQRDDRALTAGQGIAGHPDPDLSPISESALTELLAPFNFCPPV